jgi:hypothetical protein
VTDKLDKAFEAVSHLPENEQDEFAAFILDELASERRWSEALAASPDQLATLAQEARDEYEAGETVPFEPTGE